MEHDVRLPLIVLFSVVIPTCDRPLQLALCLDRLAVDHDGLTTLEPEIIVSDDGRTDVTRRLIAERFPWVTWVPGPGAGPASNRNHGASVARGEWLVFTDDDCLPEPGWLASYQSAIRANPSVGAFEGAIHPTGPVEKPSARCPVNMNGGRFWSANIAVRRDVFVRVGGFSPLFPYAASEDQDLYYRLQSITEVPFVGAALVKHPVSWPSLREQTKSIRLMVYSHTLLCLRHPRRSGYRNLASGTLQGVVFHLRVIKRSIQRLDWRGIAIAGAYLTWGSACGWWYYLTLKRVVARVEVADAR